MEFHPKWKRVCIFDMVYEYINKTSMALWIHAQIAIPSKVYIFSWISANIFTIYFKLLSSYDPLKLHSPVFNIK